MLGEIFGMDGIVLLVVVLAVLFGSSQIPRLARSLGSAKGEFKAGLDEHDEAHQPGGITERSDRQTAA